MHMYVCLYGSSSWQTAKVRKECQNCVVVCVSLLAWSYGFNPPAWDQATKDPARECWKLFCFLWLFCLLVEVSRILWISTVCRRNPVQQKPKTHNKQVPAFSLDNCCFGLVLQLWCCAPCALARHSHTLCRVRTNMPSTEEIQKVALNTNRPGRNNGELSWPTPSEHDWNSET